MRLRRPLNSLKQFFDAQEKLGPQSISLAFIPAKCVVDVRIAGPALGDQGCLVHSNRSCKRQIGYSTDKASSRIFSGSADRGPPTVGEESHADRDERRAEQSHSQRGQPRHRDAAEILETDLGTGQQNELIPAAPEGRAHSSMA